MTSNLSSKRLISQISESLPTLLPKSSVEELEQLRNDVDIAIKLRKTQSPYVQIREEIKSWSDLFATLDFGDSWKSDNASDSVRVLEDIDFKSVAEKIKQIDDVEAQWSLANNFTEVVSGIISGADGEAGKLVNGSAGEFCGDTAQIVESLWKVLTNRNKFPSSETYDLAIEFKDSLGDYGDLSFIDCRPVE